MNRLLYKCVVAVFLMWCSAVDASTIYAKITGDTIEWNDAKVSGSEIQPLLWQPSDKFHMLPIKEWTPAFYQNNQKDITFSSSTGAEMTTQFKHTGIDFRTSTNYTELQGGIGNGPSCQTQTLAGRDIKLRSSSSCSADFILDQGKKVTPFEFYRPSFELPSLVADFMKSKLPAGRYIAQFTHPVAYYLVYEHNQVDSYQIYYDQVQIVIDYKPSFIDSVQVLGDGVFDVEYNTDDHSASGKTRFRVHVGGYITPAIKMSFKSSGDKDDFSLAETGSNSKIPYDLVCDACEEKQVIDDGVMKKDFAKIDFEGKNLLFNLDFSFDNLKYGDVSEGDYSDAVTVIFEVDI